jgi:hypothetical protein
MSTQIGIKAILEAPELARMTAVASLATTNYSTISTATVSKYRMGAWYYNGPSFNRVWGLMSLLCAED